MPVAKKKTIHPFLVFLVIFSLWAIYRYFFQFPEWADEFIFKPLLELAPVCFVVIVLEKQSWKTLGFSSKNLQKKLLIGLVVGLFIIGERIFVDTIGKGFGIVNPHHYAMSQIILFAFVSVATGAVEETIFRGYFFQKFLTMYKNEIVANVISSLLFLVDHFPLVIFVYHYSVAELFFYSIQIFTLGVVFAYVFARTKSLVPSAVAHELWNFANVVIA